MDVLWETLEDFVVDFCEYYPESIPELEEIPKPTEFLNNYVNTNLPFVLRSPQFQTFHFPAIELWKDNGYLRKLMEDKTVTVAVTPDGRADSIVDDLFMIPEERKMLFDSFLHELYLPTLDQVYYLQKQNNNLIEEFSPLAGDVPSHVPWATEALASRPEAVNIWIGDEKSVTSLHKDHYENIYYVITGHKRFVLYPPVSVGWMPYKKCKKFQWYYEDKSDGIPGIWHKKDLNEEVEWIEPSHQPETLKKLSMYNKTKRYVVNLSPGDALYLPAMWFHEVEQREKCIAVNYWYDMKFDFKYPFIKLFTNLCKLPISGRDASVDTQTELQHSLLCYLHDKQKEVAKEEVNKISLHKHVHK